MLPSSLRMVSFRCLRCPRGKSLALLIGEFLQALLQPLSTPFTALGYHFRLDLRQARKRLLRCIHMSTLLPLVGFYAGRGTVYPSNIRTVSRCALQSRNHERHSTRAPERRALLGAQPPINTRSNAGLDRSLWRRTLAPRPQPVPRRAHRNRP